MGISIPHSLHIRIPRLAIYLLVKYLAFKLNLDNYIIGGSYRRKKWTSNDIDIVLPEHYMNDMPSKMKTMKWHRNILRKDSAILSHQYIRIFKFFGIKKAIVIDMMPYTPENYGNILVFATGSTVHNVRIRESLVKRGFSWQNPRYILNIETGEKLCFRSEEDFFKFTKFPYKKPGDR